MQVSSTSASPAGSQAQRVLASLLQQTSARDRQEKPSGAKGAGGPPPGGPPAGPPPGGSARQFASNTLSGLLSAQETQNGKASGADDLASKLIDDADSDGDGALSLDEIQTTLGAGASDALSAAVASLDSDGDGKLSAEELSAGLDANRPERGAPPAPPSAGDVASKLIGDVDSDKDGALSLAEIMDQLGVDDEDTDLASSFGKLDADGDGRLGSAELTAALDAFQATIGQGGQRAQAAVTA